MILGYDKEQKRGLFWQIYLYMSPNGQFGNKEIK